MFSFLYLHALSQLGARLKREYQQVAGQCFNKETDLAKSTAADVQRVRNSLNNRSRKALNYHPHDVVFAKLTAPT
jgi:IS30 family transposase|tara:strand:- start:108 stop:332 length:225 start_codon:yes stop_codon:yes gene_type:complete